MSFLMLFKRLKITKGNLALITLKRNFFHYIMLHPYMVIQTTFGTKRSLAMGTHKPPLILMHLPDMSSQRMFGAQYFKLLVTCNIILTDLGFLSLVVPLHWKLTIFFIHCFFSGRTFFWFITFTFLIIVQTSTASMVSL